LPKVAGVSRYLIIGTDQAGNLLVSVTAESIEETDAQLVAVASCARRLMAESRISEKILAGLR